MSIDVENVIALRLGQEPLRLAPRDIPPTDWQRYEENIAEIFEALGMPLDTPGTAATPERFLRALYDATAGYDGDPKLLTAFPTEATRRPRRGARADRRGPDRVLGAVRAPRAAVPRVRAHRVRRRRLDHRDLEADAARSAVRAPVHGAGADGRGDRRHARAT